MQNILQYRRLGILKSADPLCSDYLEERETIFIYIMAEIKKKKVVTAYTYGALGVFNHNARASLTPRRGAAGRLTLYTTHVLNDKRDRLESWETNRHLEWLMRISQCVKVGAEVFFCAPKKRLFGYREVL